MDPVDHSTSLFASIPKLADLCCIRCIFFKKQTIHDIFKNVKHYQIVFCRDIIRTFPTVIVAPIPATHNNVYVIMTKSFYETKRLQRYLNFRVINYGSPQRVTAKIFKLCTKYTIIYKLLPVWNRCDKYLCAGQNFKTPTDEIEAVTFDLEVKDEGIILRFSPLKIKVYPLNLESIGVSQKNLEKFYNNPNGLMMLQRQNAFIMPSFHKCKLLKVTKEIPEISHFKSYDVIRDHWKHMYGIDLPRSSKNINYYLVSISEFENSAFVYAEVCLQASLPKIIECNNQTEISNRFLNDLKEKVTEICGNKISFECFTPKSSANFVEPMEVQKTPSLSLVKNPYFNTNSGNTKMFSPEPKNLKNLLLHVNVNSPTKSFSSNCSSFSFQNTTPTNNSLRHEISGTYSKGEFVKNWLLNSCTSQTSSIEADSSNSKEEHEKLKDSPLEGTMFSEIKRPLVRSVETVNLCLSSFKKRKI